MRVIARVRGSRSPGSGMLFGADYAGPCVGRWRKGPATVSAGLLAGWLSGRVLPRSSRRLRPMAVKLSAERAAPT
jgi:hypothetical protein